MRSMQGVPIAGVLIILIAASGVVAANEPPMAEAGLDQDAIVNSTVFLDAGGSWDPDGEIVSYEWRIERPNGTMTTSACRTCPLTEFVPRQAGRYNVTIVVIDDDGASTRDTMFVDVSGSTPSAPPSNGSVSGPTPVAPDRSGGSGSSPSSLSGSPVLPQDDQIRREYDPDTESRFVFENSEVANGRDFVIETNDGGEIRIPQDQFDAMSNSRGQVSVNQVVRYLNTVSGQDVSREELESTIQNRCDCASELDLSDSSNSESEDSDQQSGNPDNPLVPGNPNASDASPTLSDPVEQRLRNFVM